METLKAMSKRKSTRAYKSEQIKKADLDTILAAGCTAPVGKGDYASLHLTVIQNPDLLKRISSGLAKIMKIDTDPLYNAPTLVLVSAAEEQLFPNIEIANAACVIQNMLLAATDAGLDSVYIWGAAVAVQADPELSRNLGIPDGFKAVSSAALGYAQEPDTSEKKLAVTISLNMA